ncbi:MAG: hypothetical protein A3A32_02600 [Candidatus Wildermuthbacteria bacterium RIFCSPLOWO2_01_FULL_48_35]|uniref:Ribbon-helix-helix protein CopG domain-containing protein n=1 Tax=Candidatus Wildermuthbacteria bacterium RIFCSPLOWO2_01_FULL_48_35 TaxID=1802463 RepID=A0A1G2RSQ9_9BACT|nr:MAG: hypothetical protein A3A32_02600 [Candidatus Wildermuthbacteria bacterium RIFCSPLOWO2_01_FULL_48_35]
MLTRRTNVLFTEDDYGLLKQLSRLKKVSIGDLVREAVRKTHKQTETLSLKALLAKTRRIGLKAKIKPHEWKEFINEGRKL